MCLQHDGKLTGALFVMDNDTVGETIDLARQQFHAALVHTHETHAGIGDVEAAAARFCQVLRRTGLTPERALIDAKAVIEEAIDGDNILVAERAVTSCIQYYFRD